MIRPSCIRRLLRHARGRLQPCRPPVARAGGRRWLRVGLVAAVLAGPAGSAAADPADLGEIIVTATLLAEPTAALPASVTVLGAETLASAGFQHLEDVLGLVPNLNWSAGSSRPRYFQVRGIGELEQYEGAPNPSVGFLLDDIDFSGLGMVATLFDLERVEVLRGPQSTRYGANALGGLIYARSQAPTDAFEAHAELTGGDHGSGSAGVALSGPLPALDSTARLAVQRYRSDGFYLNSYLNRHTDARDERTARLRWRYVPSPLLAIDVSALHGVLANGYDAFAVDNTRRVQSDHPGEDSQRATGASLRATYTGFAEHVLTLIATDAHSESTQAYDADWGNPVLWAPYTYDFVYRADFDRVTRSLEARLARQDRGHARWVVGAYAQQLAESIHSVSRGAYADPSNGANDFSQDDVLASRYRANSTAVFGQLDGNLSPQLSWSAGARLEQRRASYHDAATSLGAAAGSNQFAPRDTMAGGHLSLSYALAPHASLYASLSRGYKAGGFNLSQGLPASQRTFGPEGLVNLEVGQKLELPARGLRLETALFYMHRQNLQIRTSEQLVAGDPNTFVFYTGNAARGFNAGFEGSLQFRATPTLAVGASLGLLRTRFERFALVVDGTPVADRAQPHAPAWQAAANALWRHPSGWFGRLDLTGMGAFYFDVPPNDTSSRAYTLVHARVGFEHARWAVSLYGRNLFNRDYAVRGFYFGNEPPDFPNRLYTQLGEPREWGVVCELRL
jgi:iron complex outermembrane recepter protein